MSRRRKKSHTPDAPAADPMIGGSPPLPRSSNGSPDSTISAEENRPREPADLPPELHELTADFEIYDEAGRGGTAVVYRARERAIDRLVAIKVIRARYLRDDELVARLEREARMVARLTHPNVVALHTVRRLRHGSLALVMQYVDGITVRELLRRAGGAPLDPRRAIRILADVARALSAAHSHGVVHRDVKPENIYLEHHTSRALLADFGAAAPLANDARLTIAGMTIGTPGYLAPEVIDGGDATPRSDVYALGLVGWEILAGRQPWAGNTLLDILTFRKLGHLPRVDELRDDVPGALAEAIDGALARNPQERWPGADAFLSILLGPARPARRRRPEALAEALVVPVAVLPNAPTVRFRRDGLVPVIEPPAADVAVADVAALESAGEPADFPGSGYREREIAPVEPAYGTYVGDPDQELAEPTARGRRGRRVAIGGALAALALLPLWLVARDRDRERAGDIAVPTADAPATITVPVVPSEPVAPPGSAPPLGSAPAEDPPTQATEQPAPAPSQVAAAPVESQPPAEETAPTPPPAPRADTRATPPPKAA